MALAITIAGVSKNFVIGTLRISETKNGRATASFDVRSNDGTYRPALDAEVLITEDGTRKFGGHINRVVEQGTLGHAQGAHAAIVTSISAADYHQYAERRSVQLALPAGTMKAALTTLLNYLTVFNVTLDSAQVDGPTLPALDFDYRKLSDILTDISKLTGNDGDPYVWKISPTKVLSMTQPSTEAAPFNITASNNKIVGDVSVEVSRDDHANRIILRVANQTETNRVETFEGDGTTTEFALEYQMIGNRGGVYVNGVFETLGTAPATWTYDADDNTITRTSAPASGATISITFDGTLADVVVEDDDEITAHGQWEKVATVDHVPSEASAESVADAILAQSLPTPKVIRYLTLETGIKPGQSQTITLPLRDLAEDVIITDVELRDHAKGTRFIRAVKASSSTFPQEGWRDTIRMWSSDRTGGGSGTAITAVGSGTTPVAAGPNRAVQFNDNNAFGGEAQFTWDKTTDSLVAGGGGSNITAGQAESCAVFGYDCHIRDA